MYFFESNRLSIGIVIYMDLMISKRTYEEIKIAFQNLCLEKSLEFLKNFILCTVLITKNEHKHKITQIKHKSK